MVEKKGQRSLVFRNKEGKVIWTPFSSDRDAEKIVSEQENNGSVTVTGTNSDSAINMASQDRREDDDTTVRGVKIP